MIHSFNWKRFLFVAIAIDALLLLTGCGVSWVAEASSIVTLLGPAIASALEILAAFGVGLSPVVAASIAAWGKDTQTALTQVGTLITQYNTAEASAQPGILGEIQSLLSTVSANLAALLPTIRITDPATQAKVIAVFNAVAAEISALVSLIPTLTAVSKMEDHTAALLVVANAASQCKLKSAHNFASDFNKKAGALGKQYEIKQAA
jgi:hypothetical protein